MQNTAVVCVCVCVCVSECDWVSVRGVYDWSSILSVCWAAANYTGKHWTGPCVWKDSLQVLQVSTGQTKY